METLEKTSPHFVRCIKSNKHKAPCQFDDELVLRQLRYTGMVQTVKIRKAGYSVRMSFEVIYLYLSVSLSLPITPFLSIPRFLFQIGRAHV